MLRKNFGIGTIVLVLIAMAFPALAIELLEELEQLRARVRRLEN